MVDRERIGAHGRESLAGATAWLEDSRHLVGAAGELRYAEAPPPPGTEAVAACVWRSAVAGAEPVVRRVVPDGCVEVAVSAEHEPLVFGPQTGWHELRLTAGARYAGVRLRPGRAATALGVDAGELTDRVVALAAVCELPDSSVSEPARATATLHALLRSAAAPPPAVLDAALALMDARPWLSVGAVARASGCSTRTLERHFGRRVGLRPVEYRRVARFRHALAAARAGTGWARAAAEAGYADQAHLVRDARRLSGAPPSDLLRARRA